MDFLFFILLSILLLLIILDCLYLGNSKNSIEIVRDMGIGYNFGNTFDSYSFSFEANTPEEQITLNGNTLPTKQMIKKIKKVVLKQSAFQ